MAQAPCVPVAHAPCRTSRQLLLALVSRRGRRLSAARATSRQRPDASGRLVLHTPFGLYSDGLPGTSRRTPSRYPCPPRGPVVYNLPSALAAGAVPCRHPALPTAPAVATAPP